MIILNGGAGSKGRMVYFCSHFVCCLIHLWDVGVDGWASIHYPSLVTLEKVVVSCLLEPLQSLKYRYTHSAVREIISGF